MAGNRQHDHPRLLMRGFASRYQGQKVFTWVFPKNHYHKEVSLRDVGTNERFYGPPGAGTLDESISVHETAVADVINRLRSGEPILHKDHDILCRFLALQTTRTRHLREGFEDAARYLLTQFEERIGTRAGLQKFLLAYIRSNPQVIEGQLQEMVQGQLGVGHPAEASIINLLRSYLPTFMKQMISDRDSNNLRLALEQVRQRLLEILEQTHRQALLKITDGVTTSERLQHLKSLEWQTVRGPTNSYVYGDVGLMAWDSRRKSLWSLISDTKSAEAVMLPIADTILLVGSAKRTIILPSVELLRTETAALSRHYFIASLDSQENICLHSRVGSRASLLSHEQIDAILDSFCPTD